MVRGEPTKHELKAESLVRRTNVYVNYFRLQPAANNQL